MTPRNLRMMIVAALALAWAGPSYGLKIRFAQITDAHLLDAEKVRIDPDTKKTAKPVDSRPENERALRWAVDEINRRNAAGPAYEFVVFTGDFGLEERLKGGLKAMCEDPQQDMKKLAEHVDRQLKQSGAGSLLAELDAAAARFRPFLQASHVRRWILVPGNNDLVSENPATIQCFHKFAERLQLAVGDGKEIVDFAPSDATCAQLDIGDCRFVGFDDASFKCNYSLADSDRFSPLQKQCVEWLDKRVGPQAKAGEKKINPFVYIFCHIPDVDDPGEVFRKPKAPVKEAGKDAASEEAKAADVQTTGAQDTKTQGANGQPAAFPKSAWRVNKAVRDPWVSVILRSHVKRIFAGHFHSSDRRIYLDPERFLRDRSQRYDDESFTKLLICPPLAVKFQREVDEGARGFRDVRIDEKTGDVTSEVVWLNDGPSARVMGTRADDRVVGSPTGPSATAPRLTGWAHLLTLGAVVGASLLWAGPLFVDRVPASRSTRPAGRVLAGFGLALGAATACVLAVLTWDAISSF